MIEVDFKKSGGLIPAISRDTQSGEVLMPACINEESRETTLYSGIVHYFKRSRNKLWKKGETAGNTRDVKEIRVDYDNDCILIKIHQVGDTVCHSGYKRYSYPKVKDDTLVVSGEKRFNPKDKYGE